MARTIPSESEETATTIPTPAGTQVAHENEIDKLDAYWRAANYLSVGQIYLYNNPLLKEPVKTEHIKPRLLGHWGTTPGLNFIYVHLNRVIRKNNLSVLYIAGPGHGGPALVANTYLEGTYSEVYPDVSQDEAGMKRLFTQFSFPGGIPSHVAPETPGSIHEGGELGYSLSHAYGAAFDNPDLLVACVIGDGEAETGPLATSWHSNKFLNPATDGAVLPILHLNGYKIASPTVLARIGHEELELLLRGYGYRPYFVEGDDPTGHARVHGGRARRHRGRDSAHPTGGARSRNDGAAAMARVGASLAEGMDRTDRSGRQEDRGVVAIAPGADGRDAREPRPRSHTRRLDEELPARGTLRFQRSAASRTRRTGPEGRSSDGRKSPRQRRRAVERPAAARFSRLRGRRAGSGRRRCRGHAGDGTVPPRRDEAESRDAELPSLQPGREQLEPLAGRPRRHRARVVRRAPARATTSWRPTGG